MKPILAATLLTGVLGGCVVAGDPVSTNGLALTVRRSADRSLDVLYVTTNIALRGGTNCPTWCLAHCTYLGEPELAGLTGDVATNVISPALSQVWVDVTNRLLVAEGVVISGEPPTFGTGYFVVDLGSGRFSGYPSQATMLSGVRERIPKWAWRPVQCKGSTIPLAVALSGSGIVTVNWPPEVKADIDGRPPP